ncbi:MAG: T9SS type A sorting domain-containing protein [Bacteroidia bacterium]|nr:T9SS type A sorting domain-containing protein [Bacteroidia bacterium]
MNNIYMLFVLALLLTVSEKSNATDDTGVISIDTVQWQCAGPHQVYVHLKNFGTSVIDSVYVDWTVNGIPETSLHHQVPINPGDSVYIALGSYTFTQGVMHDFKAWTREPNGVTDLNMANDTAVVNDVLTALSGVYTIGGTSSDFMNFNVAVSALIAQGVCGPVEFSVRTGVYIEQVTIPEIIGSSPTNHIAFYSELGDSTTVVLTHASATSLTNNYTLQLNGVDNISFAAMSFERSGTGTASGVVEITNESNDVTFAENQFRGPAGITTSNSDGSRSGIYSPMSHNNNNLRITGNYFKDNACGIWSNGDASSHASGTIVENNVFENFYVGVFLLYQDSPQITGNTFTRNSTTGTVDYYGISIRFTIGPLLVSDNRITSYTGNYGIRLRDCVGAPGSEGWVVNNFAQVGGTGTSRGISVEENSGYQFIYYNSVHCTGTSATLGRSFYADGATTAGIQLLNNIFANSGGGYSFYATDNAQTGITLSDYNCLYSSGSVGYWTNPQLSLSDFQTASFKDSNSVSGDPLFTSAYDLHAAAGIVGDAGLPIANVQFDIDDDLRDLLTPDIGADEFLFVGIAEQKSINTLYIYPNPAQNFVQVKLPSEKYRQGKLFLKDISGRSVLTQDVSLNSGEQLISLDLRSIPTGFYLLGIESNGERQYSTLIKSN